VTRLAAASLLLVLAAVASARAATLAGVELPDTVTVDGTTLVLNGIGLREATRLRIEPQTRHARTVNRGARRATSRATS